MRGKGVHVEILVEDISGKKVLDTLVPRILGTHDTFQVHSYKGIGTVPKHMKDAKDPSKRILLTNLPKLLKGYGRTFAGYGEAYRAAVVVICDLDDKDRTSFLQELNGILSSCDPAPDTRFCLAIEEGEAWFLGDLPAVKAAYPHAKDDVLASYVNDSICGTWERLADAVYPGGSRKLIKKGWQAIGAQKSKWAEDIAPRMNLVTSQSPSFCFFRDELSSLVADPPKT
jgi:hypothetical protein